MTLLILAALAALLAFLGMPAAFEAVGVGAPIPVHLSLGYQGTADVTPAAKVKSPIAGRLKGWRARCSKIGGGTPFTDVDLVVKNYTAGTTLGTTAIVDGSAIVAAGGVFDGPATEANRAVAVNDDLGFDLDVTGGASSPTVDGVEITFYIVPLH